MGKNFENTIGSAPHVYSITAPPEVKNNTLQKNIESLVETIRNGIINGQDIEDDSFIAAIPLPNIIDMLNTNKYRSNYTKMINTTIKDTQGFGMPEFHVTLLPAGWFDDAPDGMLIIGNKNVIDLFNLYKQEYSVSHAREARMNKLANGENTYRGKKVAAKKTKLKKDTEKESALQKDNTRLFNEIEKLKQENKDLRDQIAVNTQFAYESNQKIEHLTNIIKDLVACI